jgi:hypothetical protein
MKAAGILISDKTIGIWRVELPGGNWLAHLFHNGGGMSRAECTLAAASHERHLVALPVHVMMYRFRWNRDGTGERPWAICGLRPGTPDVQAIERVRDAQSNLMTYGLGGWELLRGERSSAEFFAALREMPGMAATAGGEVLYAK